MSNVMANPADPDLGSRAGQGPDIRSLARKARERQISGHALMSVGLGLAVFASALLLWAGIVEGPVRVILLLVAALTLPARLLINRLGALTPADGIEGSVNSRLRRWLSHAEGAGLLVAGGLSAFGSGHDMGAVLGPVCAALLLLAGARGPVRRGYPFGLHPSLLLALTALLAVFEPAWGWRGQSFLVGLNAIAAVLIVQVLRRRSGWPQDAERRRPPC